MNLEVGKFRARILYVSDMLTRIAVVGQFATVDEARTLGVSIALSHPYANRVQLMVAVRDSYTGWIVEDVADEITV